MGEQKPGGQASRPKSVSKGTRQAVKARRSQRQNQREEQNQLDAIGVNLPASIAAKRPSRQARWLRRHLPRAIGTGGAS